MSPHAYHHVVTEDGESLSVFPTDGGAPIVANSDHPHFAEILEGARDGIDAFDLRGYADLSTAVAQRFSYLTERVAVANGRVYFDGDVVDNSLTHQMRRFLDAGVDDWAPLARFLENIAQNQLEHSREMLYDWLASRDFTITEDGYFVAYKGVGGSAEDGYRSLNAGHAIVNGEHVNGVVPNAVGDVIEMPRGEVEHAPEVGCSTGLHVGTFSYAKGYARGGMLKVYVNPRDVVSVPSGEDEKMRVCRYRVAEVIDAPDTAPVVYAESDEEDDWESCENCGDEVSGGDELCHWCEVESEEDEY